MRKRTTLKNNDSNFSQHKTQNKITNHHYILNEIKTLNLFKSQNERSYKCSRGTFKWTDSNLCICFTLYLSTLRTTTF